MDNETSARLEKMESHLAHLEHQVDQLNEVIIAQGKTVDWLKKQLLQHSETMETLEMERIKGTNAKPPHYQ